MLVNEGSSDQDDIEAVRESLLKSQTKSLKSHLKVLSKARRQVPTLVHKSFNFSNQQTTAMDDALTQPNSPTMNSSFEIKINSHDIGIF